MSTAATISFALLVVAAAAQLLSGQTTTGPSFDPTPVQIPPLMHSAPRAITGNDLLSIRDLHGVSISPNGQYIAFIVGQAVYRTNGYRSSLFVVGTVSGSQPMNLGSAGLPHWDQVNEWAWDPPQWSPDSRWITYRMKQKAGDEWQIWRWSATGGIRTQVTHVGGNVIAYEWTRDGHNLVLSVTKRPAEAEDAKLFEKGILYDDSFSPGQGIPFRRKVLQSKPAAVEKWIHEVRTGVERKATQDELKEFAPWSSDLPEKVFTSGESLEGHHILDAIVSPNGRMVAYRYLQDDKAGRKAFVLFAKPVRGGTPVELTSGAYFVEQYWWSPDSSKIYYTEYAGDGRTAKLMLVPATGGKPEPVIKSGEGVSWPSVDNVGRFVAGTRQNNLTPPQVAIVDLRGGTVRTVVDLNPEFGSLQLSSAIRLDWKNKYGDPGFAYLVKPLRYEPGRRYPLIITTYRSGDYFLRGGVGDEYPIQVFAANGFAVMDFDVGIDRNFTPGDFEAALFMWKSPIASMEEAINKAYEMGIIDRDRVGITGLSHGAEMVEYSISHTNLFRAAIESGSANADPCTYYLSSRFSREMLSTWGLGGWPEGKSKPNWQVFSSTLNANLIFTPLLVNAADSEFIFTIPLYQSLKELRKPAELFVYADELHIKNQPKHRYEIYVRNLDWFRFWLKGDEDHDPAKAEQYARWRELRRLHEGTRTGSKE